MIMQQMNLQRMHACKYAWLEEANLVQHPTWNTNQRARMHQKLNSDVCRGCQKAERNNGIAKEEMKEALVSRQALHVRRLAGERHQSQTQDTYANGRDSG